MIKDNFEMISHDFSTDGFIKIIPIADVHWGSVECKEKEFRKFLSTVGQEGNTYFVLVGDLCDVALKNSKSDIYKATKSIMQQQWEMVELLKPLAERGKILAITSGNHENRMRREVGTDPTYIIAQELGIGDLYRPEIAFVKIRMNPNTKKHERPTYSLVIAHGSGGGSTYAFVNKNNQFGYALDGADILITGHTHKPVITIPSKFRIDLIHNTVSTQPFYTVTATSWMNYGGYAAEKMLLPGSCKHQEIILSSYTKDIRVTM